MKLMDFEHIDYFQPHEFDSPDVGSSWKHMDFAFVRRLDKARKITGIPFVISSGARSEKWNKRVGGSPTSSHLWTEQEVCASDIECDSSTERFIIVSALIKAGFTRIGIGKDFIHVDSDERDFKPQNIIFDYYK